MKISISAQTLRDIIKEQEIELTLIYTDDILLVDLPATLKARGLLTLANGKTLHQL